MLAHFPNVLDCIIHCSLVYNKIFVVKKKLIKIFNRRLAIAYSENTPYLGATAKYDLENEPGSNSRKGA